MALHASQAAITHINQCWKPHNKTGKKIEAVSGPSLQKRGLQRDGQPYTQIIEPILCSENQQST